MTVRFRLEFRKPRPVAVADQGFFLEGTRNVSVILVHGLTGTPNEMRFIARHLNRCGYSVACPRLANHGQPLAILKRSRWEEYYQSVRDAFHDIRDQRPGDVVYASGLSMGAVLSLLLAADFPDEISAVSCLSPTLFYDGWNVPWTHCFLPLACATPLKHIAYFKEDPPYGIKSPAIQRRIDSYYREADLDDIDGVDSHGYPYFPVSQLCELNRLVRHLTGRLSEIEVPVQLIQAADDDMTSVRNSQQIYDGVGSSIKEMVLLHDSYHVITADQERATVARKMAEFFERLHPVTADSADEMEPLREASS